MDDDKDLPKEEQKDEEPSGDKHVMYKLLKALGDNPEGAVIPLPEETGKALCKAGHCELAKAEDMGSEVTESDDMSTEPVIANAMKGLENRLTNSVASTVAKAIAKQPRPADPTVPATQKEELYKGKRGVAQMVRDLYQAQFKSNVTSRNRLNAYENDAVNKWQDMGFQAKSLGINETTNSQGGYVVNPEFSKEIYVIPHTQIDLLEMCEKVDANSNIYNQRYINESSLVNGSIFGGLNVSPTSEGATFSSSLPAWANLQFTVQKFGIFVYWTSEVMEDASYPLERDIQEYSGKAFLYGLNSQFVQGSTLEGLINSPGAITVAASGNDTAYHTNKSGSVTYADIASMWARVYPDAQTSPQGIWLFHPSQMNALSQLTYTFNGTTPAWSINYTAQDGLGVGGALTPYRLFGKPAYASWACSAPGTAGDIIYVDLGTCKNYTRPYRVELSKEFQFGTDQYALRLVRRLDARTIFRNPVTGVTGSDTFSAIVLRGASGT